MARGPPNLTSLPQRGHPIRPVPRKPREARSTVARAIMPRSIAPEDGSPVTGLTKGQHTLRVTASDALGNTASTNFTWSVDSGPPRIKIVVSPDRFTSSATAAFRLGSNSDPVLFLCMLDDLPEMPGKLNEILGPFSEGPHRLAVWGLDAAMNRSDPLSYRWDVDTIPPGLILTGTPEDGAMTPDPFGVVRHLGRVRTMTDLLFALAASEFVACGAPVSLLRIGRWCPHVPGVRAGSSRERTHHSLGGAGSSIWPPPKAIGSRFSRTCQTRGLRCRHGTGHLLEAWPGSARSFHRRGTPRSRRRAAGPLVRHSPGRLRRPTSSGSCSVSRARVAGCSARRGGRACGTPLPTASNTLPLTGRRASSGELSRGTCQCRLDSPGRGPSAREGSLQRRR